VLGVWLGNAEEWENFKSMLQFGSFKRTTEESGSSAIFLDLELDLVNGGVVTKTYEKPLNLFPAHPTILGWPTHLACLKQGGLSRSCPIISHTTGGTWT